MKKPHLAISVAILAVSFSSILIRWSESPPLAIAFYRLLFTTLILLPGVLIYKRGELRQLDRRKLLLLFAVGLVLSVHFTLWITSLQLTTVASSVVLVTAHPLYVAALSHYILKEGLDPKALVGISLSVAGVVILFSSDLAAGGGMFLGDVLAFVAGIAAGTYILSGRRLRADTSLLTYATLVYGSTTAFLLLYSLVGGVPLYPVPRRELLLFLTMALVPGILGHTLYNWSLKYVNASVVSVSLLGEPIGAALLAFALLGEIPGELALVGGGIILTGIYMTARYSAIQSEDGKGNRGEKD